MKTTYLLAMVTTSLVPTTSLAQPVADLDDEPPVVFNGRSFPMFPAKVQPMLMNLCSRCHCSPTTESRFKLQRVREGYADTQSAGRNARAAIRFLNRDDPAASPLLVKAVTAHGGLKDPPLHSRAHPAFKNLEYWAYWALSPEGAVVPHTPVRKPEVLVTAAIQPTEPVIGGAAVVVGTPTPFPTAMTAPRGGSSEPTTTPAGEPNRLPPLPTAKPLTPPAQANPDDPFDPVRFNTLDK